MFYLFVQLRCKSEGQKTVLKFELHFVLIAQTRLHSSTVYQKLCCVLNTYWIIIVYNFVKTFEPSFPVVGYRTLPLTPST